MVNPEGTGSSLVLIFGISLPVNGLINLIGSILYQRTAVDQWIYLVIGKLEIGVAVSTFLQLEVTGTALAILVSLWALFKGLIELMAGIALRDDV